MAGTSRDVDRRPLVALLVANTVSQTGNRVTMLAIPWFVLTTGGSAIDVGLVGFFGIVPVVLSAFLGGALVDRLGFRRVSIVGDFASAVGVALIPLFHETIGLPLALLLLLVFVGALFDSPGSTARQGMLPDLTDLAGSSGERVNSAYQTIQRLANLLGPLVGGLLIAWVGPLGVLWVDAVTFVVSGWLVWRFVPSAPVAEPSGERYLAELRTGFQFIRADALLRWLAILILITNALDAVIFSVATPVFAKATYDSAGALGVIFAMLAAGAVLSSILYGIVGRRLPRRPIFTLGFIAIGLPLFVLAFSPPLWLACVAVFLCGFGAGPVNPILMTVRQERVPVSLRGRVFGTFTAMSWVGIPFGTLVGGVLIEGFGVAVTYVIAVGLYVLTAAAMTLSPAMRQINERTRPPRTAPAS